MASSGDHFIIYLQTDIVTPENEIIQFFKKLPNKELFKMNLIDIRKEGHTRWKRGFEIIQKELSDIQHKISQFSQIHFIGLGHIPFVILIGHLLEDRTFVQLYQRQYIQNKTINPWNWPNKILPKNWRVDVEGDDEDLQGKKVILIFEQSFSILFEDLPFESLSEYQIIRIFVNNISREDLRSPKQLEVINTILKETLANCYKSNEIHIFAATPVATAFLIGQNIKISLHPQVFLYRYKKASREKYKKVFILNKLTTSKDYPGELSDEEFEKLIQQPEGPMLDYKRALYNDAKFTMEGKYELAKDVSAFANTDGGKIILGIKDKTLKKVGVNLENVQIETMYNILATHINPPVVGINIYTKIFESLWFLIIDIPESDSSPHEISDLSKNKKVYVRNGSTNLQLTHRQVLEHFRNN